jgi:hypothetical protein
MRGNLQGLIDLKGEKLPVRHKATVHNTSEAFSAVCILNRMSCSSSKVAVLVDRVVSYSFFLCNSFKASGKRAAIRIPRKDTIRYRLSFFARVLAWLDHGS